MDTTIRTNDAAQLARKILGLFKLRIGFVIMITALAGFAAPGTFSLAMVFLVAFVLYYFINWKYLSQVWGLS